MKASIDAQQSGYTLDFIIDEEFRNKYPPLSAEDFSALENSILEAGRVREPLVIWHSFLIDGYNRFQILQKHPDLPFSILEEEFTDRYEAIAWICKNQLGFHNLTPQRRTYLLGKRYEAEKKTHGGDRKSAEVKSSAQSGHLISEQKTCERIAAESKVSKNSVRRAETFAKGIDIAEEIRPGLREEILSGSIKVSRRELSSIVHAPPQEQPQLVDLLVNKPDEQSNENDHPNPRPIIESVEASFPENEQLDNMLGEMEDAVDTIVYRWERCFSIYHKLVKNDNAKKEVRIQVRKLKDYLKRIEEELKYGDKK